jgi:hypothetical protein
MKKKEMNRKARERPRVLKLQHRAGAKVPAPYLFCKRLTPQGLMGGGRTKDCEEGSYGNGEVESSKMTRDGVRRADAERASAEGFGGSTV